MMERHTQELTGRIRNGMTGTGLKYLALLFMVMDHIAYFFEFTGMIPDFFRMAGRLSAPLFIFCVVEGFSHTHDRKRYFLRIWLISAGMGTLQYIMAVYGVLVRPDGFYPLNAVFMNFVILVIIWQGMDWIREKKWMRGLAAVAAPLLWPFAAILISSAIPETARVIGRLCYTVFPAWNIIADGGLPYILIGIIMYAFRKKRKLQMIAFTAFELLFFGVIAYLQVSALPGFTFSHMFTEYFEWFGLFSVFFMMCYNGKRGSGHKRFFYVFYIAHVYVLYALSWLFMAVGI